LAHVYARSPAYWMLWLYTANSQRCTLSNLTISSGTLTRSFSPSATSYTASVANNVSSFNVTPTANNSDATITINGTAVASGQPHPYRWTSDLTTLLWRLQLKTEWTYKKYVIIVTRATTAATATSAATAATAAAATQPSITSLLRMAVNSGQLEKLTTSHGNSAGLDEDTRIAIELINSAITIFRHCNQCPASLGTYSWTIPATIGQFKIHIPYTNASAILQHCCTD